METVSPAECDDHSIRSWDMCVCKSWSLSKMELTIETLCIIIVLMQMACCGDIVSFSSVTTSAAV